jgi:hypothetical protein
MYSVDPHRLVMRLLAKASRGTGGYGWARVTTTYIC